VQVDQEGAVVGHGQATGFHGRRRQSPQGQGVVDLHGRAVGRKGGHPAQGSPARGTGGHGTRHIEVAEQDARVAESGHLPGGPPQLHRVPARNERQVGRGHHQAAPRRVDLRGQAHPRLVGQHDYGPTAGNEHRPTAPGGGETGDPPASHRPPRDETHSVAGTIITVVVAGRPPLPARLTDQGGLEPPSLGAHGVGHRAGLIDPP